VRILNLQLERYGPFTGRTLTFQPDAKLHIVYGPNEAGKSCSLAAVTDLLFGIDRQTSYDFLHDAKELRIGATIVAQNGNRLSFRRRKGNKNTLIDANDQGLGDDALVAFLGNLSRDVFCRAFGLNTPSLRLGAEEMLNSQGDIGASLFAAASGLRGLTELRRSLDGEADSIFALRASKERRFYQALDRYEEARKAIREHELKVGEWKDLNEAIDGHAKRLNEIKVERSTKTAEHARLSRLKQVLPLVRLIDQDLVHIAALGTLPEMPAGFTERLRVSLEAANRAEVTQKRTSDDEARATRDHAAITVDNSIIAESGNVLSLFSEIGAYTNNRRDSPRIQAEADDYQGRLAEITTRLGLTDAAALERDRPTDAEQAQVRTFAKEGRTLAAELTHCTDALAKEGAAFAKMERQRSEKGSINDPRPFREKLTALNPVLKQLDERAEIEQSIHADERQLKESALRLKPAIIDIDALALISLPGAETIARFRRDLDKLVDEITRATEKVLAADETATAIKARLRDLTSGRPVPTADAIAAKRQERDEEWGRLRSTLFGQTEALAGAALPQVVADFERHSSEADRLADDAVGDAARVAAHKANTALLEEEGRKKGSAKELQTDAEARLKKIAEAWTAIWAPAGIAPLPPSEMAAWLLAAHALLERREKLNLLRGSLAAIETTIRGIEPALAVLANELGLQEVQGLSAGLLAARIEDRLRLIFESWDRARDLDTRMQDTQGRIEDLTIAQREAANRRDGWQERWTIALPPIGLSATATPDEAEAALGAWKEVPDNIRERDSRTRRVVGMQRDITKFEAHTKTLVDALAPDLATMPSDAAAKALNDRLSQAKVAEARRTEAAGRLDEAKCNREGADTTFRDAAAAVTALAAQLPKGTDLAEFLSRSDERNRLLGTLTERRVQLIAQAEGHDEESLRGDLATFDADQAEATLKALSSDDDRLDQEAREAFAAHDRSLRERARWEQSVGAEVAVQQRRSAESELAMAAREWAVLKLGALLIGRVVEERRASQHDPLIARASILFSTLTGSAFSRLGQDYDEQDVPRLVGQRNSGKPVPVAGMSDGTRDQLYLALRLAYLEDYASRCEPSPFIGDDIFTTFDDDRTAHGLAALAAIGERVQPILFTHHTHVVEIARAHMGAELDVISLG
jgi:uncharacterized protein YhaN